MAGATLVLFDLTRATPTLGNGATISNVIPSVTFGALGGLVASRQSRNLVGWMMLTIATTTGASGFGIYVTKRALLVGVSAEGWVRWPAFVNNWTNGFGLGALILVLLLFPTGTPLG